MYPQSDFLAYFYMYQHLLDFITTFVMTLHSFIKTFTRDIITLMFKVYIRLRLEIVRKAVCTYWCKNRLCNMYWWYFYVNFQWIY